MTNEERARRLALNIWLHCKAGSDFDQQRCAELVAPELADARRAALVEGKAQGWEEAASDLTNGLPAIWKKVLIDRCLFKAQQARQKASEERSDDANTR